MAHESYVEYLSVLATAIVSAIAVLQLNYIHQQCRYLSCETDDHGVRW